VKEFDKTCLVKKTEARPELGGLGWPPLEVEHFAARYSVGQV